MNVNQLSEAQIERIAILMEECSEVIQICGKILRHGYNSYNPFDEKKIINKSFLEKELGDVLFAIKLLETSNEIDIEVIKKRSIDKIELAKPFLHHQNLS